MNEPLLDLRGLACPEPVVRTRKALLANPGAGLRVLVDNPGSAENVSRMAASLGFAVARSAQDSDFALQLTPATTAAAGGDVPAPVGPAAPAAGTALAAPSAAPAKLVVLVSAATFGSGDDALGALLMRGFLRTLQEYLPRLDTLVFVNGGVRLAVKGSDSLEFIQALAESGVRVLVCGTCLNHFGLTDELAVGRVSNMFEIVGVLVSGAPVVRP